jgi:uncharacterized protein
MEKRLAIPKELLDILNILVCPVCRTPVRPIADESGLQCATCKRIYPIRDGFPAMLPEEATIAKEES